MTEVVFEIGGNHCGSLDNALRLIAAGKEAGGNTVKFQCFEPERLAQRRALNTEVLFEAKGRSLLDLYRQIHTPKAWFPKLIARAKSLKLDWFSSVFDPEDVAFLETLNCPRYKLSAFEILDWELIRAVKATGKPIVMSVRPTDRVTVLLATDYKGNMPWFGISDHGGVVPSMFCPMVEWHLKLPDVPCLDADFSITPQHMAELVKAIGP